MATCWEAVEAVKLVMYRGKAALEVSLVTLYRVMNFLAVTTGMLSTLHIKNYFSTVWVALRAVVMLREG